MGGAPDDRFERARRSLDEAVRAGSGALSDRGVLVVPESVQDWAGVREKGEEGFPVWCHRFLHRSWRCGGEVHVNVFLYYAVEKYTFLNGSPPADPGRVMVWSLAALFRPGAPNCASHSEETSVPLGDLTGERLASFVWEKVGSAYAAIESGAP